MLGVDRAELSGAVEAEPASDIAPKRELLQTCVTSLSGNSEVFDRIQ